MKYTENHKLGDVIADNYQLLLLLSRFGIPLGFGDKSVKSVCADSGVDCKTFLALCNYVATGDATIYRDVDVLSMLQFLRQAHVYYADFLLPELRAKLVAVVRPLSNRTFADLVVKLFDSYAADVKRHLAFEEKELFDFTRRLVSRQPDLPDLQLMPFIRQHDNIDTRLAELKNAMMRYLPEGGNQREVYRVLYDIFAFEDDLQSHCDIEGNLFIPALVEMKKKIDKEAQDAR